MRVKKRCLELLERVETEGAYVHILLQQEASLSKKHPEEYPVMTQLVRGVLEQRTALEEILSPLLPKGLSSLPLRVQLILKLGAYQICFLERVQKRDVVYEAVELVKAGKWRGFEGLVNAVLRKVEPDGKADSDDTSTINFPRWLVERWNNQFGESEVSQFCATSDRPLPLYLRVNTRKISSAELKKLLHKEGVDAEPVEFCSASLRVIKLPSTKRINNLQSFRQGLFFVQDVSSTLVGEIVSSSQPATVRDVCAAPGGKTCSIALSLLSEGGAVTASDRSQNRVKLIKDLVGRLGLENVSCCVSDIQADKKNGPDKFDVVLVDAPCSGFGTAGRKIDVRWTKSPEVIEELITLQGDLLDRASACIVPGGFLVYSTCTIDVAENEGVVQAFLARHPEFKVSSLSGIIPDTFCTPEGYYRAWPHRHGMAGAFAARLVRL